MRRFFSFFAVFCLALTMTMVSFEAEARRFGGGRSFGRAPISRQATAPSRATNKPTPAQSPMRNWRAPLMGFMAGGLLASLFMGGGFSGINFFDILIVALLAFFVIRFLKTRAQLASGNSSHMPNHHEISPFSTNAPSSTAINAPLWFNAEDFVVKARHHFTALQKHWDANEMDKIAEYVTPEMLGFLKQERANAGDGYQSTYIDNLQVYLETVEDQLDRTVATLTFTGIEKSSRFDQGESFSENWRMERDQGVDKPWLIAGIQQNMS